jgi:DNA-binding MurR/RpiR family transcriptional regulator
MGKTQRITIAERLRLQAARLTPSENALVACLLSDYPVPGLASMPEFARRARVSTPTVLRMAKKLGFAGFPAFQKALREEVAEQLKTPIAKHDRWSSEAPDAHILNRFGAAVFDNLRASIKLLDHREFDALAGAIAGCKGSIHVIGGRITKTIAEYLFTHLHMVRPGVSLVPPTPGLWPQYLLNMAAGDILVMFDVRRYDPMALDLARAAKQAGAKIVLVTDQWTSPIAGIAAYTVPLRIEAPSSWDSNIVPLFIVEALIAAVANLRWPETKKRIGMLEALSDAGRRKRT